MTPEEQKQKVVQLRESWNAPARHVEKHAALSDKHKLWNAALAAIRARRGTGFQFALIGNRGPGKTQIGIELMIEAT